MHGALRGGEIQGREDLTIRVGRLWRCLLLHSDSSRSIRLVTLVRCELYV